MVLGTSDVRLIDMTRAFAAVQNRGVSVMPYAIRKVVTADGRLLYQHQASEQRVLVAPWVSAGMTDLLQTAVLSGTGRAAQIGRPVAGKTGTTSSNKDGWFIGFSSGITTGVWMGRDDARAVGGLQGGTAPARAFADFMKMAVAKRPVEQFETQVPLPDWQLEPDEEAWGTNYVDSEPLVDADGNPIGTPPTDPLAPQLPPQGETDQWLDEVLRRNPEARQQPQPQLQQRQQPPPRPQPSEPPPDPLQPRP
jgi:penicillin-binding protein 1A